MRGYLKIILVFFTMLFVIFGSVLIMAFTTRSSKTTGKKSQETIKKVSQKYDTAKESYDVSTDNDTFGGVGKINAKATEESDCEDDLRNEKSLDYLKKYESFLNTKNSGKFQLLDFDDDDIHELVYSKGDAHYISAELYTVKYNKIYRIGNYGSYGDFYYVPRSNLILSNYYGMGIGSMCFYRLNAQKEEERIQYFEADFSELDEDSTGRVYYTVGDRGNVSFSFFSSELEKIICGQESSFVKSGYSTGLIVNSSNIRSMMNDPNSVMMTAIKFFDFSDYLRVSGQ